MKTKERILVTGASGSLGNLILEELLRAGQADLMATPRTWKTAALFSLRGVDIRSLDFYDPIDLLEAFRGVTKLLLIGTLDLGRTLAQNRNAIEAARKAGVRHIVYLSCANPKTAAASTMTEHRQTEELIKASGLKYTFLRNYLFAENLQFVLPRAVETGTLYGCAGNGRIAYVTRRNCAAAAAGALLKAERFEDAVLEITGPEAFSHSELADLVSEITGKSLCYVDLPSEEYKAELVASGLPELFAPIFVGVDRAAKHGELGAVTDAVLQLTGEHAEDIREALKLCL
ncbi:SDR family oxidoreductase [Geomonas azotofigens]|uniref:SDR family oxidoreductase n=1 Tax=Geomonas azotofigens TaxID=2843196 RepID=UPI001C0F61A0|nr:SDR family oxidoreductase [Geomonas azotofigens]MBU5613899.1 SDR family oxidoreductase [Geomonas azotofigens]